MCLIWLHIQSAAAFKEIDRAQEGLDELKIALSLAMPDNILMPFAENITYIATMLSELKKDKIYTEYIERIEELADAVQAAREKIKAEHFEIKVDYGLSEKETEIAGLAARRMTTSEIAKQMHLSTGTVRNYLSRIYSKMGITGSLKNKRIELEKLFKE